MRKRFPVFLGLILVLLFSITLLRAGNQQESVPVNSVDLKIKADPPIQIFNNSDFVPYPGVGTENQPYVLENYVINSGITAGIWIENTTVHFIIRNCTITNFDSGIKLDNVSNGLIENTTLRNNQAGISSTYCTNLTIINNSLSNNYDYGIDISNAINLLITNNTANSNDIGLYVVHSNYTRMINNTVMNNGGFLFGPFGGIRINNTRHSTVSQNTASNNIWTNGISVYNSENITLSFNTANSNSYKEGIFLNNVNHSKLFNNTAKSNQDENIELYLSHYNLVENNTVHVGWNGIYLANSSYNNISHNLVTSVTGNVGLLLWYSDNNRVMENTVLFCRLAIYLHTASYNFVAQNTASYTQYSGISLFDHSCFNTIYNNTCNHNNKGIALWELSNDNTVTWNTVINNSACITEITCFRNVIENNNCQNITGEYIPGFDWVFILLTFALFLTIKKKRNGEIG